MKKSLFSVFVMFAGMALSPAVSAQALRTVYGPTGWHQTGHELVQQFEEPTYVERLNISATGAYGYSFSRIYVYADGDQVALLGVPGTDPQYPVVIRKAIRRLELRVEGYVNISSFEIEINCDEDDAGPLGQPSELAARTPGQLGKLVLSVVHQLQDRVSDTEFRQYLMPLRKSGIMLAAKGDGRVLLSNNTQTEAKHMIALIKATQDYLLSISYNDHDTRAVEALMFVKERLEAIYEL